MENIHIEVSEIVKEFERKFASDENAKRYEEADKNFIELVEKGIAKSRGHNLAPLNETHLRRVHFNTSL